jgi:hypothetical protein
MLNVYNKTITELGFCDNPNYQVSVSVISLSLGSTDNTYLDNFGYHKNVIQIYLLSCSIYTHNYYVYDHFNR